MPNAYVAMYLRTAAAEWPSDIGDDPSFTASLEMGALGGRLTWGVCRPNIRNRLQIGDVVAFFAADRFVERRPKPVRYCFVGYATVEKKVSQTELWTNRDLAVYRNYVNLLVARRGTDEFEHIETFSPRRSLWHDDWLWRIADNEGLRKKVFVGVESRGTFDSDTTVGRRPLEIACNYVIFAAEGSGTFIAADPPEVATAHQSGVSETWHHDPASKEIYHLIFDHVATGRRRLRTTNPQTAHPHIALRIDAGVWGDEAWALMSSHQIRMRPALT
jgi:hypothetical protein